MSERVPPLTIRCGAYHHRDVPREDGLLTHPAPNTPCGEYLRRFWHPIAHSKALVDLPVPVKVMHEDLVLFRDKRGRVGLLQKHSCHRRTSLEFAKIEAAAHTPVTTAPSPRGGRARPRKATSC